MTTQAVHIPSAGGAAAALNPQCAALEHAMDHRDTMFSVYEKLVAQSETSAASAEVAPMIGEEYAAAQARVAELNEQAHSAAGTLRNTPSPELRAARAERDTWLAVYEQSRDAPEAAAQAVGTEYAQAAAHVAALEAGPVGPDADAIRAKAEQAMDELVTVPCPSTADRLAPPHSVLDKPSQPAEGDPVAVITGEVLLSAVDTRIDCEPMFALQREYASRRGGGSQEPGRFGVGWACFLDVAAWLAVDGPEDKLEVRFADGVRLHCPMPDDGASPVRCRPRSESLRATGQQLVIGLPDGWEYALHPNPAGRPCDTRSTPAGARLKPRSTSRRSHRSSAMLPETSRVARSVLTTVSSRPASETPMAA